MRYSLACLGLIAWLPVPTLAVDTESGASGGSFLKMGQGSARAMALGRSYVGLAEGADSLNWNMAGLGVTQQKEVVYSYMRTIKDVSTPLYLAYAHPMGRTVWGVNMGYLTVGGIDARDETGRPVQQDSAQIRDGFGTLGIARSFWYEKLFLGGGIRLIHEDIVGSVHDTLVGDVGALFKPNNVLSVGFSAQNMGGGKTNASSVVRGGAGFKLGDFVNSSIEVNKESDNKTRVGLGAEFSLPEEYLEFASLTLRIGFYTADNLGQSFNKTLKNFNLDRSNGFSFGFGLFTSRAFGYGLSVDYAAVPSGALGTMDQISLKVKF